MGNVKCNRDAYSLLVVASTLYSANRETRNPFAVATRPSKYSNLNKNIKCFLPNRFRLWMNGIVRFLHFVQKETRADEMYSTIKWCKCMCRCAANWKILGKPRACGVCNGYCATLYFGKKLNSVGDPIFYVSCLIWIFYLHNYLVCWIWIYFKWNGGRGKVTVEN